MDQHEVPREHWVPTRPDTTPTVSIAYGNNGFGPFHVSPFTFSSASSSNGSTNVYASSHLELDSGGGSIDVNLLSIPPFHPSKLLFARGSRVFQVSIESAGHLVDRLFHALLYRRALTLGDCCTLTLSERRNQHSRALCTA